jgi:hypothetical protein
VKNLKKTVTVLSAINFCVYVEDALLNKVLNWLWCAVINTVSSTVYEYIVNFINFKSESFEVISEKFLTEIVENNGSLTCIVMNMSFPLSSMSGWFNMDEGRSQRCFPETLFIV